MYKNPHYSEPITVRIFGRDGACFTRPEHRTERLSNIVASHSAWEGCLQGVMGHKGAHYQIDRVGLLFWPRWRSMTSNEISDFGNGENPIDTTKKGVRTLRTTTFLCGEVRRKDGQIETGVDFLVSFRLLAETSSDLMKYRRMLVEDRLGLRISKDNCIRDRQIGQQGEPIGVRYFRQPNLGLRELTAEVEPVLDESAYKPVDFNMPLGICYYGRDWTDPARPHYFTELSILHGVCLYPTWDEVRRNGVRRKGEVFGC